MKKRKLKTGRRIIIIAVAAIFVTLAYFQLFYKPALVDQGHAILTRSWHLHKDVVTAVRFTEGDSMLVTSGVDSVVKIWNVKTGKIKTVIRHPAGIAYMDLSKDGHLLATGGFDAKLRIYNKQGILLKQLEGHTGTIWTVAFSEDAQQVASSGDGGVILIHDVKTGKLLHQLKGHHRIVWSVKFSPDGNYLASGSFDRTVKLWQLNTATIIWNNTGHDDTIVDLGFSNDGNLLATTSDDKTVKLWDWKNKNLLNTFKVPEHVQAVAFSPDDKLIVAGGRDKPMIGEFLQNFFGDSEYNKGVSARLWEVKTGKLLHTFSNHKNDVMDLAFSANGKFIASASADQTVDVWQVVR